MSRGKYEENGLPQGAITLLLQQGGSDDPAIQERLYQILYAQLRVMAAGRIRNERAGITLQATDLVHEAWFKLIGQDARSRASAGGAKVQTFESRQHFFSAASNAMRQVLIDAARARQRLKRGGGMRPARLQDHEATTNDDQQLLALDEALELLRGEDPIKAELVTLRYFGGLTNAQVAEQLGISTATAERYWAFARAWLKDRMS
jgi:RNA polymerase sigma factor (TIGR02999 family)